jgi:hypothetical protein
MFADQGRREARFNLRFTPNEAALLARAHAEFLKENFDGSLGGRSLGSFVRMLVLEGLSSTKRRETIARAQRKGGAA